MKLVDEFKSDVLHTFEFLTKDLGFVLEDTGSQLPEMWCHYQNSTTEITVSYEAGSTPWVEIAPRRTQGERVSKESFSLELLLEERLPSHPACSCLPVMPGTNAFRECLESKAAALRDLAADILRGDFSIMPKMQIRRERNRRRREAELFGNSDK